MKIIISILAGIVIFSLGFWGANTLINWAVSQFPQSAKEWYGIIKIILWLICFSTVLTISIVSGTLISTLFIMIFEDNTPKMPKTGIPYPKSRFQQRLDDAMEKQKSTRK